MKCTARDLKEAASKYYDSGDYEYARAEEFAYQLSDFINAHISDVVKGKVLVEGIDEGDMQNFIDAFEFPDEDIWALNEATNACIDAAEQLYDMMKDER
jgi:methionine synthase II (cobalamin-independent)